MLRLLIVPGIFLAGLICSCGDAPETVKADTVPADSTGYWSERMNIPEKTSALDTFFAKRFVEGTFSGCVLVAQHGIVLYEKAFGWETHECRDSLSLESSFQLASVSKQFTAAAVLSLVQDGKLSLDDTLRKFFPQLPYYGVTIHDLLTHRAGLDKYTNICDKHYRDKGVDPPELYTNDSVIALFSRLSVNALRKPGEKFDYSNTGYVMLASVVEKVSGKKFWKYMDDRFFIPLEMEHTWVNGDGKEHLHRAHGYYKSWNRWDDGFLDDVSGDKGVYTTVDDLFRWDRALRSGKVIQPDLLVKAYTPYSEELRGKKTWNYGYGWRTINFEDGALAVFHNGWWHGYTSTFYRGLSDDVTIIMLCNKFNKGIYNVRPLLEILGAHTVHGEEENSSADSTESGSR